MEQVYIKDVGKYSGKTVTLKGWLYNKRSTKNIHFLIFRDGYGYLQCVAGKNDVSEELFEKIDKLTQESSIIVTGEVKPDSRAECGYELMLSDLEIVQISDAYPITPKEHGTDFLMERRHLWMRSKKQHAILRIRDEILKATRDFYYDRDFVQIDSPILTPAACEGTTTLFGTEYFGEKAYLTQSGQLYLEPACMAFGKVYCFGPTFRAEKSKTRRHLTEFWMIEPEVAYMEWEDCMKLGEDYVSYMVSRCLENRTDELKILGRELSKLEAISAPFPRMRYDEAIKYLQDKGEDIKWGDDFGGGHETILGEIHDKPIYIHHWPVETKAFYMEPDPEDSRYALAYDLIASEGYGEIIGGSQRISDPELLMERIKQHGLPEDAYKWYIDIRHYGSVPHSGFGLGIERTVAWICGIDHIRMTIPYPRTLNRIYP